MKTKLYFIILLFGTILFSSNITAQSRLAFQGFEQNSSDTWNVNLSTPPCSNGNDIWDYSEAVGPIRPLSGNSFWGVQDLRGNCGGVFGETVSFDPIDVTGYTSVAITFNYYVDGFDSNDLIFYRVNVDGASRGIRPLVIGFNNYSSPGYVRRSVTVPDGSSTVSLDLLVIQNGGSDSAGFDDFEVVGIPDSGNLPPVIANTTQVPAAPVFPNTDVQVQTDITDVDGIAGAVLEYGFAAGSYTQSITMNPTAGDQYEAVIPGQANNTQVYYRIQATDSHASPETAISPELNFQVVPPAGGNYIAVQDFDNSSPMWNYTNDVTYFDNGFGTDGFYGIRDIANASPLCNTSFANNVLAENDLNDEGNGTSGFATTTFDPVDVSGYYDVKLSFDYQVQGYNANHDYVLYEVYIDGVGQGINLINQSNGSNTYFLGRVSVDIPDGASTVALVLSIKNNGVNGYSGFDNFVVQGESDYIYNGLFWYPTDPSGVATAVNDIYVNAGATSLNADTDFNNLNVNLLASLNLENHSYSIHGDINNNGTMDAREAALAFVGDAAQVVNGNPLTVENLTLDNTNGLVLEASTFLEGILDLQSGTLNANDHLTFKSSEAKNAVIAPVVGGNIIGNVDVERYYSAQRAFRFASVPVNMTGTIFSDWQQNGSVLSDLIFEPNRGTHITGGAPSDGFDQSLTNNPSLFEFNNATQNWTAVDATNTLSYTAGSAVRLMVRGDRTRLLNVPDVLPTSTTLITTGTIVTGDVAVPNLATANGQFSMIGNPYQSQVDLGAVMLDPETNDINTRIYYAWDPTVGEQGAYVVYDFDTQSNNVMGSEVSEYIQPGQAFFIETLEDDSNPSSLSPKFKFKEQHKMTSSSTARMFSTPNLAGQVRLGLFKTSELAGGKARDGVSVSFSPQANIGLKFGNPDENLAVVHNGQMLSTVGMQINQATQIIDLNLSGLTGNDYTFKIDNNVQQGNLYFVDEFTGIEHQLVAGMQSIQISFDPSDPASLDTGRFHLKTTQGTLSNEENTFEEAISVYPNPLGDEALQIAHLASNDTAQLEIFNMSGQLVKSMQRAPIQGRISLEGGMQLLSEGVYVLRITQKDQISTFRIVKK